MEDPGPGCLVHYWPSSTLPVAPGRDAHSATCGSTIPWACVYARGLGPGEVSKVRLQPTGPVLHVSGPPPSAGSGMD